MTIAAVVSEVKGGGPCLSGHLFVLGKERDDEEGNDDQDDTQIKKVIWKEAYEGLQTSVKFANLCSSMSAYDVKELQCAQSKFSEFYIQSSKQAGIPNVYVITLKK
ncbi:hypothetical protein AVEN_255872-1 [Araneus ventricosus]|uniref:Uncharacterized protein n=1 Tax=Araneus ventricosus TaxID=182803 RepID=A0A4Y2DFJ7_ARAVE|nr:hypothetical protein AVEN_255872-1 [Araneus ventricosus]